MILRLLERALAWLLGTALARFLPRGLQRRLALLPHREAGRRLLSARRAPAETQARTLRRIVEANRKTEFGRAHAFGEIEKIDDYLRRVPLRTHAELEPYLARQQRGEPQVVVADPPVGFALSGGSRGSPRAIPVTRTCLERWAWAEELLLREAIAHAPSVASGCELHLLPLHTSPSRGGRPLLPFPVLHATTSLEGPRPPRTLPAALPSEIFSVAEEAERYYLALRLGAGQRVTLLRAATPGTLALLAQHLERFGPSLCEEIGTGTLAPGLGRWAAEAGLAPRPDRALARRLASVLERKGRLEPRDLWPSLELLVCSTTGSARAAAERLSDRFGSLPLLDPGYRAAEGILSLPWLDAPGGELALGALFLELLPEGASATLQPDALELGGRYQPVVTGMNGLYRYLMDDVVEVTALEGGVPRLELAGRARFRLRLESGELREEQVGEGVVAACRDCELRIAGFTAWLQRPDPIAATQIDPEPPAGSWLARLIRKARRVGSSPRPSAPTLPALAVALEPAGALEDKAASRIAGVLDSELGRCSSSYDAGRTGGVLGPPTILLLKPGTLARRCRRRIAEGCADAHAPFPPLSDDPWVLDPEEVERQV